MILYNMASVNGKEYPLPSEFQLEAESHLKKA